MKKILFLMMVALVFAGCQSREKKLQNLLNKICSKLFMTLKAMNLLKLK